MASDRTAAMDAELEEVWSASDRDEHMDGVSGDEDREYRPPGDKRSRVHVQHGEGFHTRRKSGIVTPKVDLENVSPDRPNATNRRSSRARGPGGSASYTQLPTPVKSPPTGGGHPPASPVTPTPSSSKRHVRLYLPNERPTSKRLKSDDGAASRDLVTDRTHDAAEEPSDDTAYDDSVEEHRRSDDVEPAARLEEECFVDDEAIESDNQASPADSPPPRLARGCRVVREVYEEVYDSDNRDGDSDHEEDGRNMDHYDFEDGWLVPDDQASDTENHPHDDEPKGRSGVTSSSATRHPSATGASVSVTTPRRRSSMPSSETRGSSVDGVQVTPTALQKSRSDDARASRGGLAAPAVQPATTTHINKRQGVVSTKGKEKQVPQSVEVKSTPAPRASTAVRAKPSKSSHGVAATSAKPKVASSPVASGSGTPSNRTPSKTERVRRAIGDVISPQEVRQKYATRDTIPASFTVQSLPSLCEVTNPELFDDVLADDYAGLAKLIPLKKCNFVPWRVSRAPEFFRYSEWSVHCPDLDNEQALEIIRFARAGRYINPARSDPRDVQMKLISSKPVRYHFNTKDTREPVVFVVVTCCTEAWLREARDSTYPSKLIKGLGLSQEIQRIYGYFGMVCNRKDIHAQLFEGSLDYSTQSESGTSSGMSEQIDNYALTVKDTVLVYDGRKVYFDVNADLAYLEEMLPRYDEDILPHSCVVVGHTTTCFKRRSEGWGIGFNIKWAVVLATPAEE
ncbi:hypothetical protein BKA70DRAFT_1345575 [Coprinopsis sp. MPI-PUGE-AT-0042]|nr:hypothetical protein BKA70DRAFT_1345575 [Coprinopsis sp. MPI-PUGE-AT-0042]